MPAGREMRRQIARHARRAAARGCWRTPGRTAPRCAPTGAASHPPARSRSSCAEPVEPRVLRRRRAPTTGRCRVASTRRRSSRAAAIARMPEPVPRSSIRRGRRCAMRSSARRQPRVEPCSPEPNATPASSTSVIRPGTSRVPADACRAPRSAARRVARESRNSSAPASPRPASRCAPARPRARSRAPRARARRPAPPRPRLGLDALDHPLAASPRRRKKPTVPHTDASAAS